MSAGHLRRPKAPVSAQTLGLQWGQAGEPFRAEGSLWHRCPLIADASTKKGPGARSSPYSTMIDRPALLFISSPDVPRRADGRGDPWQRVPRDPRLTARGWSGFTGHWG